MVRRAFRDIRELVDSLDWALAFLRCRPHDCSLQVQPALALHYDGPVLVVPCLQHSTVFKVFEVLVESLHVRSADNSNLPAVESLEAVVGKSVLEPVGDPRQLKVDEGITDIAPIVHVHGEVKEIISSLEAVLIDLLQERALRVLIRNVPKHHSRGFGTLGSVAGSGLQVLRSRNTLRVIGLEVLTLKLCVYIILVTQGLMQRQGNLT
mmetsp:Transcript_33269/g.72612  ORF Transcript_33269/g.72612 Transcript_33269/m.72612 type:complete len:208 (-) Transcript_33269:97-720(-)